MVIRGAGLRPGYLLLAGASMETVLKMSELSEDCILTVMGIPARKVGTRGFHWALTSLVSVAMKYEHINGSTGEWLYAVRSALRNEQPYTVPQNQIRAINSPSVFTGGMAEAS